MMVRMITVRTVCTDLVGSYSWHATQNAFWTFRPGGVLVQWLQLDRFVAAATRSALATTQNAADNINIVRVTDRVVVVFFLWREVVKPSRRATQERTRRQRYQNQTTRGIIIVATIDQIRPDQIIFVYYIQMMFLLRMCGVNTRTEHTNAWR